MKNKLVHGLALSKANDQSGCMQMIPGSHKNGFFEHHSTEDKNNVLSRGQTVKDIDINNAIMSIEHNEYSVPISNKLKVLYQHY